MSETTDARYERERSFHDQSYAEQGRERAGKFYAVTGLSRDWYRDLISRGAPGRDVLEYGCGIGSAAFDLAALGDRATGIDISGVAIDQASREAARRGLSAGFVEMNAEKLDFPQASFDLVCGTGVLHHLDIDRAMAEVARTLRPDGRAVFVEPLGHNPLINLYRRLTPGMRTPDEHPLLAGDFALMRRHFRSVEVRYFHLLTLLAVPFRRFRWFGRAVTVLDSADAVLFRVSPFLGRFAWTVVVDLAQPVG